MDATSSTTDAMSEAARRRVVAAMLVSTFMAAAEVTVISTAMPTIVARLGGFNLFTWAFGIYLLGQAVTTPIYGRLADLYGRRARLSRQHRPVPGGLAALRPGLEHAGADRLPRHPGAGRRRAGAAGHHHHRRRLAPGRTGHAAAQLRRRASGASPPSSGRMLGSLCVGTLGMALRVLDQPARRRHHHQALVVTPPESRRRRRRAGADASTCAGTALLAAGIGAAHGRR